MTKNIWEDISTDIFEPIPLEEMVKRQDDRKRYLITFTDRFSRWTRIGILKKLSTQSVIKKFEELWLNNYEKPKTVLIDQGTQFTSAKL